MMKGKHDPMITKDEFDKAQKILKRKDVARPSKNELLFSNLLKCKVCGFSICGTKKHKVFKRTGKTNDHIYYRCSRMNKQILCNEIPVNENTLFHQFMDLFGSIEIEKEFLDWTSTYYKEVYDYEQQEENSIDQFQKTALTVAKNKLKELLEMRLSKEISPKEYQLKKQELTVEIKKLEGNTSLSSQWYEKSNRSFIVAYLAQKKFKEGNDVERKAMIHETNSNLFLKDGFILPVLKKSYFLFKKMKNPEEWKNQRFEPVKESYLSSQTFSLALHNPSWYPLPDSNRRFTG